MESLERIEAQKREKIYELISGYEDQGVNFLYKRVANEDPGVVDPTMVLDSRQIQDIKSTACSLVLQSLNFGDKPEYALAVESIKKAIAERFGIEKSKEGEEKLKKAA